MPFTHEDAELFRGLAREVELKKLLAYVLDEQIPLAVVMGESGVGKTSLLRAGLSQALEQRKSD
jgi:predicted ribonuclease YlaK